MATRAIRWSFTISQGICGREKGRVIEPGVAPAVKGLTRHQEHDLKVVLHAYVVGLDAMLEPGYQASPGMIRDFIESSRSIVRIIRPLVPGGVAGDLRSLRGGLECPPPHLRSAA